MRSIKFLGLAALLVASVPAQAQSAGGWRVDGAVAGRTFKLDCALQPAGGICVEAAPGGKRYALTGYSANGDQATWTFKTKVAFIGITLTFAGRVAGNRMSGTIRAAGRTGAFTAVRR
jgi:hypothetical protein